jgi:hypothetical protein
METKQYEQGWIAYFDNIAAENPYTKPEWVLGWNRGFSEAEAFNKGF